MSSSERRLLLARGAAAGIAGIVTSLTCAADPIETTLNWNDVVRESNAIVSVEVCVEPPLRRGHPIHDQLFAALKALEADYAHFQPWNVFPRLAVAELQPPEQGTTYWDFSLMDPIAEDFMRATAGHPVVFNVGTLPAWMFQSSKTVNLPEDPDEPDWSYSEFNQRALTDATIKLAANYQARVAGWYVNGGFNDENGKWHESGHHYAIEYWEVLNDPDFEGSLSPADYTRLYDGIVAAVHEAVPSMKFMGPVVGDLEHAEYFMYFLNPKNHKPGTPIDMISYHVFSMPDADESDDVMSYTVFQQADKFLMAARYIEVMRQHFLPKARTYVVDVATMLPDPLAPKLTKPIPRSYWNLSGGMFAYMYAQLALLGIHIVGISELIDYPGMAAALTLVDWDTGRPNARYWVMKLLRESFNSGDKLIRPPPYNVLQPNPNPQVYVQGFLSQTGDRRILFVNKRNAPIDLVIPGAAGGKERHVDQHSEGDAATHDMSSDNFQLPALAVAVVTLPK